MKYLLVGDPHIKLSNIKDGENLFHHLVLPKAKENTHLVILGDLFDTHATVRLEVQHFWKNVFYHTTKIFQKVIVLVGNHDMILGEGTYAGLHSLETYSHPNLHIISEPKVIDDVLYMPYIQNDEKFVSIANSYNVNTIMAHQTFLGAKLANNYIMEGVDLRLLKASQVISGHIHTSQKVDKCFYTGTPLFLTVDDANQNKSIYEWDSDTNEFISISTAKHVTPIIKFSLKDGDNIPTIKGITGKIIVEVTGSIDYIKKVKTKLSSLAIIKAIPTTSATNRKPIYDFDSFLDTHYPNDKETVQKTLTELNGIN